MSDINLNMSRTYNFNESAELKLKLAQAKADLKEVRDQLIQTESEVDRLKEKLSKIDGGAFDDLTQAARRSVEEVRAFLKAFQIDPKLVGFDQFKESIMNGGKTALEVITDIKSKYAELFESFNGHGIDTSMLTDFIARLDDIKNSITDLVKIIPEMLSGADGGGGGGSGGGQKMLDISAAIEQLRAAAEGMPEEMREAYNAITELVKAVNEYANIDDAKLRSVSAAFLGLADIGKGSYGSKSMNELRQLILSLTEISSNGGLNLSLDLSGVKGFKLDTASIDALTRNLPKLQTIAANVDEINKINNLSLDLSGAKGLRFNAAPLESLIKVLPKLQKLAANVSDINKISKLKLDFSGVKNFNFDSASVEALVKNLPKLQSIAEHVEDINKINNIQLDMTGIKDFVFDPASVDALLKSLPKLQKLAGSVEDINKINGIKLDMSGVKGFQFDATSVEALVKNLPKLKALAEQVEDINKINNIKLDLSQVKGFSFDASSIESFTKAMPKIQKLAANVEEINKINNIDFSKLQDIKIDQSSIDAVLSLADALKILANNPILQSRFLGGSGGGGGSNGPFGSIEKTIEELERAETKLNNLLSKSSTTSKSWAPQYTDLKNAASNIRGAIEEIQAGNDPVEVLVRRFGEAADDITGYANRIATSMKRIVSEDSQQSVGDFLKKLTQMEKALNNGQIMKGTEQYEKLAEVIRKVRAALEASLTESGYDPAIFAEKIGQGFGSAEGAMQECTTTLAAFTNEGNKLENVVKLMNDYYDAANKAAQNPYITRGADGTWATEKTAEYGEQVKQLNDAYKEYNTTLENANLNDTERANIVQMAAVKEEQLTRTLNNRKDIMQQETGALNSYNSALKQSEQDLKQFAYAQTSSNETSKKAFADMKVAAQEMSAAFAAWKADPSVENVERLEEATAKYNATAEHSKAVITALDGTHKTFGATLSGFASKFAYMFSATRIMMAIYRTMKQMVQGAIELDSAMTQLQIVTGETDAQMNQFANTLATAAQRAAVPIKDLIESATTFARLGYSSGESAQLAEFTAMLQNVGNIDTSKAQDAVTSIIKAYGVSVDQIESVMDKLVSVGKMFAQGCGNAA